MNTKITILLAVIIFILSCKQDKNPNFPKVGANIKDIKIKKLRLDTLSIPKINSSYLGEVKVRKDSLYLIDRKFCWLFAFDKESNGGERYFGKGNGPSEIPTGDIEGYAFLKNGEYFFVGAGLDGHLYNPDKSLLKHYTINIGYTKAKEKSNKFTYEDPASYRMSYDYLTVRDFGDYLYYTVFAVQEGLWYYSNPEESLKNERIIAKMRIDDGKVLDVMGRTSPFYEPSKGLFHVSFPYFDIDKNGNFYVCFEVDPIIYVYDKDYKPLTAYGHSGEKMNTNYSSSVNYDKDYWNALKNDKEKCGRYTCLEYIDELDVLLRTYQRSDTEPHDGLQIYKDGTLIGDVDIPKLMKIAGYIEPYIYGASVDEDNESIKIFRFKLDL